MSQDLTKGSIAKHIRKIAIPASIGFFFNTMYNVVDTYYAGLLSTKAIAALSISFPVFFLIIAFGSGLSTGATALISNSLGEKKHKEAKKYVTQSLRFGILLSIVLTIIGIAIAPTLFTLLGASGDYLGISLAYINTIFMGTVFFILTYMLNAPLNATGDTKSFRNALIAGFFLNLLLNPMLMYGWIGLPALGITGIALATVIIQLLSSSYLFVKITKSGLLSFKSWKDFIPIKKYYQEISKQGFPAGLNMMSVAIGIFVITYFISKFSVDAVAAYGVATRIEQIALMPMIGLNIAALSMIGQNYGAKKYERIVEVYKTTLKYGAYVMIVGFIAVFFFTENMMKIFTKDTAVIDIGVPYLKIAAFLLWTYVILFMTTSALQGMKKPMFALWMGLSRQIIAPAILFTILTAELGISGIWWGVFIINMGAAAVAGLYIRQVFKETKKQTIKK